MKALGFAEHGSVFEWYHKKTAIENAGMKYIHGAEVYITETLAEKRRDNYHCVLMAKDYEGFLELNRMISKSFSKEDGHKYYVPRITFDELLRTSDHILISTACIGSILGKADVYLQQRFIGFLQQNKHRTFLEIGHHPDEKQILYNKRMLKLSKQTGIPLIAGTDTHSLNETHSRGRSMLQRGKKVFFEGEEGWDLTFKTFEQLTEAYKKQNALPEESYMEAIENTNIMADMVEEYEICADIKYPKIYDHPEETFRKRVYDAIENHPYALERHGREKLVEVVESELAVYKATKSFDFMLLQTYLREWEEEQGISCGYGRGSVSGSMIAYLLNITKMDSIQFDLNFFRFMNPSRISNADIDTDYSSADRERVKEFLLKDKMNLESIRSAEIITFNTIKEKGALRDVARGLDIPLAEVDVISKILDSGSEEACVNIRKKYPELFEYMDIVSGTIVSVGTHPSGVLVSDLEIDELIGTCSTSSSDYPVSMLNMSEIDDLMYVKLDILGLDNVGVINDTCATLGVSQMIPDNTDLDDQEVWRSIREDTTLIFQWESDSARAYLKQFMSEETLESAKENVPNFSMMKWLSFGNGLIRPACSSFRKEVSLGQFYDNGFQELNTMLAPETGRIAMQETIMRFLVQFCGYSDAESDTVRRAIAKKKGTETLLPEIERRFVSHSSSHYDISEERCMEVIKPFLQIILDASEYGFSWNHSDPYSCTGYVCGYLRYYYPLEFLCAALNVFEEKGEKTAAITKYAAKVGIAVTLPRWGLSRSKYVFDKEKNIIAKGLASVKYMNATISEELYQLSTECHYTHFSTLLRDISEKTSVDTRQLTILIGLDFFKDFGNQRELLHIVTYFDLFKRGNAKQIKKSTVDGTEIEPFVKSHAVGVTKSGDEAKSYTLLDVMAILVKIEEFVRSRQLGDIDDVTKVKNFIEVMGYMGYVSGKESDRPKLYVSKIFPLYRKKDKKRFGVSVVTKSIGSGVESRFTIFDKVFKNNEFNEGDVILCTGFTRDGPYYTMTAYKKLLDV